MRFNTGLYNSSKFNVGTDAQSSGLRGILKGAGRTLPVVMCIRARIAGGTKGAGVTTFTLLAVRVPISAAGGGKGHGKTALLCMRVPLCGFAKGMSCTLPAALDIAKTDYMQFTGVNLRPDETLYIDTDKIRIMRNGEDDITGWGGGTFFKLSPSGNMLTCTDNAPSRSLQASVIWQDRWL